jgi:hypothetical protein
MLKEFWNTFTGREAANEIAYNDQVRGMLQAFGVPAEVEPRVTIRDLRPAVMPDQRKRYRVSDRKLELLEELSTEHDHWRPFGAIHMRTGL